MATDLEKCTGYASILEVLTRMGITGDAAGVATLFAWMAKIFAALVPGGALGEGLVYYGKVTTVPDGTHFTSTDLIGFGDGKFANNYFAYVLRDAGGGGLAPQGQFRATSAYVSATGAFTHTAFANALAANDELLIVHWSVLAAGDPSAHTLASLTAKWGDIARSLDLILGARWDAAGDLGTDIANLLVTNIAGTVVDVGPAVTDFDTSLTEATNNHYNGMLLLFISGVCSGQAHQVDVYTGATKNVSFAALDQWTDAPGNGDAFILTPNPGAYLKKIFTAMALEASITALDAVVDAGFLAGAKEASLAVLALEATSQLIKTQTDKLAGAAPVVGSTTANWQTAEADVVSIGTDNIKYKLHSLILSIHNLVGTVITIRLYQQVNGVERKCYQQTFDATTEPLGVWVVNGTVGIHEVLRVSLQSNNAADNAKAVHYDYMLEAM